MRKTTTILLCTFSAFFAFGQIMEIPYTFHTGYGEIKNRSFGALSFNKHAPESSWGKMVIETKGVPEGFTVNRKDTDILQFVWQNYTNGKISKETIGDFIESWNIDTTSENLTRDFIKCYIHVAIKRTDDSTYLYIVDTNNDLDFSDETIHTAVLNDYKKSNELHSKHSIAFQFESYGNGSIKERAGEILILESDNKQFAEYLVTFPHHCRGTLVHEGRDYPLYFQFSSGHRLQAEHEVNVMHPIDSSSVSKNNLIILGMTGYKVLGTNPSKEVLLLEKTRLDPQTPLPQKEFLAPDIAGIEFSTNDSIRLSDYRGKHVLLYIWGTWCAPCYLTLPKLAALHDSISPDELQIFSAHLNSNIESLPEVIEKNNIQWPQVLNTSCIRDLKKDYALKGVPYSYLISPEGRILEVGIHGKPNLASAIRELMEKEE